MINNITSDLDNTFLIYEDEKGNEYKQPVADVQVAGTMDFIILDDGEEVELDLVRVEVPEKMFLD